MSEVDVNGSALLVTVSSAMARAVSNSVISNGAAGSIDPWVGIREGKDRVELPKLCAILNQPKRSKPLAAAMARSKAIALAGLLEMLFARG